MTKTGDIGVWLPTVRTNTGTDVYTRRLSEALTKNGIKNEITWLPHKAEYLPWLYAKPTPPEWATVVHINSWLHKRFIPRHLPVVVTFHSIPQDPMMAPYRNLAQKLYHKYWVYHLEKFSFQRADAITAVSRHGANRVREVYGKKKIEVIYNWVDTTIFKPSGIKYKKGTKILFMGNASLRKGADLLPQIMNKLGPKYHLYYTAPDTDIPGYPALPKNMTSIPKIDGDKKVVDLYNQMDALLFPTRSEGFGLAALEAKACGLAVIATDIPPVNEFLTPDEKTYLCEPENISSFTSAIIRALDVAERDEASEIKIPDLNGLTKEEIIHSYINLYSSLS